MRPPSRATTVRERKLIERLLSTLGRTRSPWRRSEDARWWIEDTLLEDWSGPFEAVEVASKIYLGVLGSRDSVINTESQARYVVGRHQFLRRWTTHDPTKIQALVKGLVKSIRKNAPSMKLDLTGLDRKWWPVLLSDEELKAFEMLSLEPSVSPDEMKRRHRALALENHPDRGGCLKRMQEINRAFEIAQRTLLDASL